MNAYNVWSKFINEEVPAILSKINNTFNMSEEQKFYFEERSSIMEYDGGLDRITAERLARIEILNLYQNN
jgi:hypothetical protein